MVLHVEIINKIPRNERSVERLVIVGSFGPPHACAMHASVPSVPKYVARRRYYARRVAHPKIPTAFLHDVG